MCDGGVVEMTTNQEQNEKFTVKNETEGLITKGVASELNNGDSSVRSVVFGALALWLGLIWFLGGQGAFVGRGDSPPLPIFFGFAIPLVVFFAAHFGWRSFRDFVLGVDLRLVAAIQAWRWAGFGFLTLYAHGVLPGLFAFPAGLGDMAIGISAPWMVRGLARHPSFVASRRYALWNILGVLDLIVAISMGTICSGFVPGVTGIVITSPMAQLPLVLIPAYLVPLFIMLHFIGLAQARRFKQIPALNRETTNQAAETSTDSPGVIVFPPALLLGTVLLSVLLNLLWPWHFPSSSWMKPLGGVLFICGIILVGWGRRTMIRAGTNVPPHKPTLVIVTDGPFRLTRNPLYLGGSTAYLGLSLGFNLVWGLILLVPMLLVLNWGIVRREERYLERKFGDAYLAYKARVPRWVYGSRDNVRTLATRPLNR